MAEIPTSYGYLPQSDFESQYRRVFESVDARTQVELAAVLDVRQSSISDAKRRKSIPAEWLVTLLDKKGIDPTWIRTGLGSKYIRHADEGIENPEVTANPCTTERRPAPELTTDELLVEIVRRTLRRLGEP